MKILILLAFCGLSLAATIRTEVPRALHARTHRTLQDDLNDFLALIPVADIEALFLDYLANDAEMQNAMTYLQSDEFEGIVLFVDSQPEVQDLFKYLIAAGLDVVTWLNGIHDFLGIPHIVITKRASGRSLAEFWEKVKALIPIDALKALYADKLISSPDFKALIDKITSDEYHNLVLTVQALPEVQALRQRLLDLGIDVEAIEQFVRDLFGWNKKMSKAARTLQDDLNDFLALIPVADIEALFLDYLANDAEMQNAMTYLQSDEFEGIVLFVDSQPEVQDLFKYLIAAGLDVVTWLNGIHDFLGIPHIVITKRASGRSLAEFWEKVKALIPIDALKALYADKLISSPDFKALIDKITSDEYHNLVLTVKALPEVQALRQRLLDLGIDVEAIEQFVRDLFGWNKKMSKAARTLQDDLNDFLALIPVADIEALFLDYLANDAEMQNAMTYLQSDEFEGIVLFVDSQPEVQDLFKYLIAAGLDVVTWLNGIHDFLGIPHIVITKRASGRSLAEFWEKVKALIPIDALKALYADKLISSPDFKALIDKITSDEFHNLVLTVKALPEVQAVRQRLLDLGIDVEAIEQFVRDLFGWNKKMSKAARTLQDDLNDFLALIPVADIEALFLDYLANDAEMQNAMTYLQSDEFEGIVLFVDSQPEVQDLFKYLIAAGLDVVTWLNGIHDFLGIPHIVITKRASGRSLAEFWEKVKALIPIDALKALYADKLISSPDFKALIDKITSDEFHNLVLTVKALPEVQAVRQRLLDLGIDVEAIEQFVRDLFGWNKKMSKAARTLQDDLNDFLALIPVADIEALFLDYLANDAEMQNAMTYLQSDEFEGIVLFVDSQPEVQDLFKYLIAAGLDVVTWLNGIHDFLGIPHIVITKRASGRSLAEFWEKVKALIPIDALKALYADKLISSPDFKALIDKITSDEFHNLVLTVKALPEVQAVRQRLLDLGIDVEAIEQFIRDLFGWNKKMSKAARTLQDDLNDFLALIPVADIEALFLDYLANDAEMQNAMTYLQSDEFEGIVLFVDSQPEVQDLFKYLIAAGLDVVTWLNGIHDFLGIPHIVITKRASGRSLAEFWEKVKALIPIDALKALYADKLISSPDFKALVDKITSDEFHNMVLSVKALPEVQALRQRLLDLGIDVEAIEQFVRDLFGW